MKKRFIPATLILYLIMVGKSRAQFDSNAVVRLYCGPVSSGCTLNDTVITFIGTARGDSLISKYTMPENASLNVEIDGTFPLTARSHYGVNSWWLDIDSIHNRIINLVINNEMDHQSSLGTGSVDGGNDIEVQFDSIPFVRAGSEIAIVPNSYKCKYYFSAIRQGGAPQGREITQWSGYCSDSGLTIDSVYLQILSASSKVYSIFNANTSLRVITGDLEELFLFHSSSDGQNLRLFDMLGMMVCSVRLSASDTQYEVPVSCFVPGCYFACLGNQVAKFMVPPR